MKNFFSHRFSNCRTRSATILVATWSKRIRKAQNALTQRLRFSAGNGRRKVRKLIRTTLRRGIVALRVYPLSTNQQGLFAKPTLLIRGAISNKQGWFVAATLLIRSATAADFSPEQIEFFESKIRPVLAQECYECHNSRDKAKSGLVLDFRQGLLDGGDLGPSIIPGKPDESILMEALRHEYDLTMPKAGVKLDPPIIADFEKWIAMGAPDPRDKPPTDEELAKDTAWESILETRKNWWSFQPIEKPDSPGTVDAFLNGKIAAAELKKTETTSPERIMRRLYFTLIGLPPTVEEQEKFRAAAEEDPERAIEKLTDELLASPHFGERWARHWMDWIRYAESHGSEGDPKIDNAHLYRDYLIRALNADVPYDQLLREHVAGDLLEKPRINQELAFNESAIAPAHWRMVFHGFAPTDALDEKVRFTDDQINVFTKAFQGLTVSCARCHDHKFDAISQADYYALFGILGSTRPGRKLIDLPSDLEKNQAELAALKPKIRAALAEDWLAKIDDAKIPGEVNGLLKNWAAEHKKWQTATTAIPSIKNWNLADTEDYHAWYRYGNGLPDKSTTPGDFAIEPEGDDAIAEIFPSGVYSNLLSEKHAARLTSPDFNLDGKTQLHVLARGGGNAMVRYVVQNYPRSGTVFKVVTFGGGKGKKAGDGKGQPWKWHTFDLEYWDGDEVHIELATARDAPLLTKSDDRSWFGIRKAMLVEKGSNFDAGAIQREHFSALFSAIGNEPPKSKQQLAAVYRKKLRKAVERWKNGDSIDADALLLDFAIQKNSLPNALSNLPKTAPLIEKYRKLEAEIKAPTRVHGLDEWTAADQPLFDRGDHKKPLDDVPRRFLDAIDPTPYQTDKSGRLELANDLLRDDNPFTRRVIVNRIWHHIFGQGIVPTADNFGRMGEKPSHPELLDYLAVKFSDDFNWSIKKMIRHLVLTDAFQRDSEPGGSVAETDPENKLLSHFPVKRLEAEAVRDSLLMASGKLTRELFGVPIDGGAPRRSVYVRVIRNNLDPFLSVYDAPVPFSATGRRPETNVPAQSLTMLNNGFVVDAAQQFANVIQGDTEANRISKMWMTALGREPSEIELEAAENFLAEMRSQTERIEAMRQTLDSEISALDSQRQEILQPTREKLEAELAKKNADQKEKGPVDFNPIGHWDFSKGTEDFVGEADVELVGGAKIVDGALIVGPGAGMSKPLGKNLKAKTLEVRVQLETLNQRGGGAMSVQGIAGEPFDSITFAEREPKRWMAGSSGFRRTKDFGATDEKEAVDQPVHLVITYAEDGTIRGFRNGEPYGKSYQTGVQEFEKGVSQVIFGFRHGKAPSGGRSLRGKIFDARLYDRALTEAEVAALGAGKQDFVSDREVRESLTESQRTSVADLEQQIAKLRSEHESLGKGPGENDVWKNLAHSIFNLKEFIYLY